MRGRGYEARQTMDKYLKIIYTNGSHSSVDGSEEKIVLQAFIDRSVISIRAAGGDKSFIDFSHVMAVHVQTEKGLRAFAEWDHSVDELMKELWPEDKEESWK